MGGFWGLFLAHASFAAVEGLSSSAFLLGVGGSGYVPCVACSPKPRYLQWFFCLGFVRSVVLEMFAHFVGV